MLRGPVLAFFVAAGAGGCASQVARPAMTASSSSISMRTNSWGELVSEWRIGRSGEGTYAGVIRVPGGRFRDYDVVVRRFSAGPGSFEQIEGLLRPAAAGFECEIRVTDGPYGRIEWTDSHGSSLAREFNYGCLSAAARRAYGAMIEAEQLIAGWATGGEIVETRPVREPRAQP